MPYFRSPAKINLFLRVLSKRPDGYHEIASLLQTISLFDGLRIEFAKNDRFVCSDPNIPTDDSNLVLKAVALFRHKTGLNDAVAIELEKHIPAEAGLGGGSGNAATTLWALNELFEKPATVESLQAWAAEIGSDVPFFFSLGSAYCTGRGETFLSIPPLQEMDVTIIKPAYGLSTPGVYRALDLRQVSQEDPLLLLESFQAGRPHYVNDLEGSALQLKPELATLKSKLQHAYKEVLMAGSGTSLCCFSKHDNSASTPGLFSAEAKFVFRTADRWY